MASAKDALASTSTDLDRALLDTCGATESHLRNDRLNQRLKVTDERSRMSLSDSESKVLAKVRYITEVKTSRDKRCCQRHHGTGQTVRQNLGKLKKPSQEFRNLQRAHPRLSRRQSRDPQSTASKQKSSYPPPFCTPPRIVPSTHKLLLHNEHLLVSNETWLKMLADDWRMKLYPFPNQGTGSNIWYASLSSSVRIPHTSAYPLSICYCTTAKLPSMPR